MSNREVYRVQKPLSALYSVPTGTVCIQVICPDDDAHIALLQGLMAKLTDVAFWSGDPGDNELMAGLWQVAYVATDWDVCMPPESTGAQDHVYLSQPMAIVLSGNPFIFAQTGQTGGYAQQNTAANGDSWAHGGIRLRVGQFRLKVFYVKTASSGTLTLSLNSITGGDNIAVGSFDMFNSTSVFNQLISLDFDVATDDEFTLIGTMSDGGGAGSTFACLVTGINIQRLGDL